MRLKEDYEFIGSFEICLVLVPYGFVPFDPTCQNIVLGGGHLRDAGLHTV
jgi:hypothetical protein